MLIKYYSFQFKVGRFLKSLSGLILCLVLFGTSGCATESALERDYGQTWAFNQRVQIADPQAGMVPTPATGMSPVAAVTVMDGYNKSFERKKSEQKPATFINLGGGN